MTSLQPFPIDLTLFELVNIQWRLPLLDLIMPPISSMLYMGLLLLIPIIFLVIKQGKKQLVAVFFILLMMGATDYTGNFIKKAAGKVRPYKSQALAYYVDGDSWKQRPPDYVQEKERGTSFPSSHSANTMVLATLAMLFWRKSRPWIFVVPIAVGYSRLYLAKHFISDVIGGYCWGLTIALLGWMLWTKVIEPRLPEKWSPRV
ncbi:MAG: phosphatase PAP2 family protein [Desulfovibrio sp.]